MSAYLGSSRYRNSSLGVILQPFNVVVSVPISVGEDRMMDPYLEIAIRGNMLLIRVQDRLVQEGYGKKNVRLLKLQKANIFAMDQSVKKNRVARADFGTPANTKCEGVKKIRL